MPRQKENEKEKTKKSFVRVTPKRASKSASQNDGSKEIGAPSKVGSKPKKSKMEVIEAEIVDSETEFIDADIAENEDEVVASLPVLLGREAVHEPDDDDEIDEADVVTQEQSLVGSSALQRYLSELRKYQLMTREEEREVATKAYEENDVVSKNRLVTANLRLVVKIAMDYRRAYSQILDLIQEGNAGLVQAVNRFNPYMGVKLSTYSAWWIRAYILKFLMDNKSLVRMGTTDAQRKLFFKLRGEAEKLYALTRRFDAKLLAENIGVKESDVIDMHQRLSKNDLSLDAPVSDDSDVRHIDKLVNEFTEPQDALEGKELSALVRSKAAELEKELNDRDLYIFQNRILSEDPVTLQDVGDKFGITRERARQLESRVIKRMKELLISAGVTND